MGSTLVSRHVADHRLHADVRPIGRHVDDDRRRDGRRSRVLAGLRNGTTYWFRVCGRQRSRPVTVDDEREVNAEHRVSCGPRNRLPPLLGRDK